MESSAVGLFYFYSNASIMSVCVNNTDNGLKENLKSKIKVIKIIDQSFESDKRSKTVLSKNNCARGTREISKVYKH